MIYLGAFFSILLQVAISSTPIFIPIILVYFIFSKNPISFAIAFLTGIFIDSFLLNPIGISSLYFCLLLFVVSLYSKKFEIQTPLFILLSTFLGSAIYVVILSGSLPFIKAFICTFIALIFYYLISWSKNKSKKKISPSVLQ